MQDIISISELATVGSIRMPTCWLRATIATTKGLLRYCVKTLATNGKADDDFLLEDHLAQRVAELFKTTKPFVDYINRAVDYVNEEMEG